MRKCFSSPIGSAAWGKKYDLRRLWYKFIQWFLAVPRLPRVELPEAGPVERASSVAGGLLSPFVLFRKQWVLFLLSTKALKLQLALPFLSNDRNPLFMVGRGWLGEENRSFPGLCDFLLRVGGCDFVFIYVFNVAWQLLSLK